MKAIIEFIRTAIEGVIVMYATSKEINEDGAWDRYHARKNRKEWQK